MLKSHITKLSTFLVIALGVLFFVTSEKLYINKNVTPSIENRVEEFRKVFFDNYDLSVEIIYNLAEKINKNEDNLLKNTYLIANLAEKYDKYGIVFTISKNNEDLFWSNNSICSFCINEPEFKKGLFELQNGWYYLISKEIDGYNYKAFMAIKRNYNYQNKYLQNEYHSSYNMMLPQIIPTVKETEIKLYDKKGEEALFYFSTQEDCYIKYESKLILFSSILLSVLSIVLVFWGVYFLVFKKIYKKPDILTFLIFAVLVFAIRSFLFLRGMPLPFEDSELFSPSLYATSQYLPSLGDLFINAILVLWLSWLLNNCLQNTIIKPSQNRLTKLLFGTLSLFIVGFYGLVSYKIIKSLVIDSKLNLDVNFALSLDYYSIIGFIIIGCLLFSFYLFSRAIIFFTKRIVKSNKLYIYNLIFLFTVFFVLSVFSIFPYPLLFTVFISVISLIIINEKYNRKLILNYLLIYAFIFSGISTIALYSLNKDKELNERKTLALKLSSDQDPIAEYLFIENEKGLLTDNLLKEIIIRDPYDEASIYNYLLYNYFYDYWLKYDMQVTVCSSYDLLLIKPENIKHDCFSFFENYINTYGKPTDSDFLFFLDNNTGRDSYIARIPVFIDYDENSSYPDILPCYYIFIEFDSKHIPHDIGFPELLVDESVDISRELTNYSFAFYKFGELTHRSGEFFYNNNSSAYGEFDEEFTVFSTENYHHLNYKKDDNTQIIVSRSKYGFSEIIAPFSYLLVLFLLLIMVFWLFSNYNRYSFTTHFNFKRRIRLSMIVIVILSAVSIGWASVWFLYNIHENKNLSNLGEKAHSVLVELEHELGNEQYLSDEYSFYYHDLLLRLSNVFFTDISLFDKNGYLIASSRSRIFEEGLVSEHMNPVAVSKMRNQNKSFFAHNEQIGNLKYLSAYIPLINNNNEHIAYINLPYFARENQLQYELTTFLVTFINIYFLILVLAIVFAFFISNYVTKPLQLIKDNLSRIRLGKINKKINWHRNDEIGSLVKEYNRMIDELEVSVELLAKNERESAWREMAKQVAHEIKNPLTPMKLSVQYLHKAWKDGAEDWEARLEGFTKTMVEQIDSLSLIAGEFSDFAKMPANNNKKIELNKIIPQALELYKDFDKVNIEIDIEDEKMFVYADPKQLLRVFNNLIKNAIQSYHKDQTAYIFIKCKKENENIIISIKDKGSGIPNNKKDKIFKPYFTTKTGGFGLGLAIVKSIVEGFNGEISFESEKNIGSTFIIKLPVVKD